MDLSNKTLGLLLVAAIVISIGGTVINLNRLSATSTTGLVTQNGTVVLDINDLLSITLADNVIDFGTCTINSTQGFSLVNSNLTDADIDNDDCTNSGGFPDYLILENNGNIAANVTLQSNVSGTTFFNTALSNVTFYAENVPGDAGCDGTLNVDNDAADGSTFVAAAATEYAVCDNFNASNVNDQVRISFGAGIDDTSTVAGTMGITFTGSALP
jgi:hypothetical protein